MELVIIKLFDLLILKIVVALITLIVFFLLVNLKLQVLTKFI